MIESIAALRVSGVLYPIPRPVTVIRERESWIVDDAPALAYGVGDTYQEALEDYLTSLVWLRDELRDCGHPSNQAQRAAVLEILQAVGR